MGYEDATLSAEYTVNTYQVKYDGNGATGTMPNSTYTYGVSYNLTSNTYQKTGYTFVGWNTDKTKTEALYLDGVSVKNLTSVNNNVVTLYAKWTRLTASMISYTDAYNMGCSNVQCAIDKIKDILNN